MSCAEKTQQGLVQKDTPCRKDDDYSPLVDEAIGGIQAASQEFLLPKMRILVFLSLASVALTWTLCQASFIARHPPTSKTVPVQSFTAPARFPKDAFESYYRKPKGQSAEPRPKVKDSQTGGYFPPEVDQPFPLPIVSEDLGTIDLLIEFRQTPPKDNAVYPVATSKKAVNSTRVQQGIISIVDGQNHANATTCHRCIEALKLGQKLAQANPEEVPQVIIDLCTRYNFASTKNGLTQEETCRRMYTGETLGAQYAQILSYAELNGNEPSDGQYICHYILGTQKGCPAPATIDLNANGFLDKWFGGKEKRQRLLRRGVEAMQSRDQKPLGPAHYGKRGKKAPMKVLHMSDIHVDPRYFVGGEGACTSGQCCRSDSFNSSMTSQPPSPAGSKLPQSNLSQPATYWGSYKCDSPWSLALSAMESVTALNGGDPVDMSLYTGDMVTHDSDWHLSDALIRYTQQAIFDTMKKYLGDGPVFSAIGNHDTAPSDSSSPRSLPDEQTREQFSYDWHNLQRLFVAEGWFTHEEAKQISRHYGGYSVSPRKGLRIITLNTDFWYKANVYNYIHSENPDASGILRFLTDELERAERRQERVWIVGHVLTGWDGTNPLPNPTNLFYQIVDHYAPKTIAHIFFGHTHEDQFNLFYANNATDRMAIHAKAVSFMAPSITPGSNVNSAIRLYTIDPETYEVMDYDQYYTQVADFSTLASTHHGPVWQHLYSARQTYSNFSLSSQTFGNHHTVANGTVSLVNGSWPVGAPLNATFWSAVTDEMTLRSDLVSETFHHYQGRNSPRTKSCNSTCVDANICYMRSGSAPLGLQCIQGYGSVQS